MRGDFERQYHGEYMEQPEPGIAEVPENIDDDGFETTGDIPDIPDVEDD